MPGKGLSFCCNQIRKAIKMNLTQLLVTQKNVDEISGKFGLSEEQTLEAMAAIIPAFSEGLKRQTASPQGAAAMIKALSTGRHQMYVDDPRNAISPSGVIDGNAILGHLFGSKDVSRALAGQASATTGIGSSIFKSLLPVIASMVMGSLFKGATGRGGGGVGRSMGNAAGGGLLGKIIEGLAGGMIGGAGQAVPQGRSGGRSRGRSGRAQTNSLEDLLGQVLGGGGAQGGQSRQRQTPMPRSRQTQDSKRSRRQQNPAGGGLGGILDELLGGGQQRQRPREQSRHAPEPQQRQRRRQRNRNGGGGLGEIFGDMLEPGGQTSREYQRQTGSVFDEFLGN